MNISNAGLTTGTRVDSVYKQLFTSANAMGSGKITFSPTSMEMRSNHEIDKQVEDNTTWVFEYKALLNSKLTTLTTSLTSAFTTDLDAAMGAQLTTWGPKNAMQGITGQKGFWKNNTKIDPGAARTTFAFIQTYRDSDITVTAGSDWKGTDTVAAATTNATIQIGTAGNITGTTTFVSGSNLSNNDLTLEQFTVDLINGSNHYYKYNSTDLPGLQTELQGKNIGNNFTKTLYNFFSKPENHDLLRFGLFNDVFVVGTSSLPTGSQTQGSIALNWIPGDVSNPNVNGYIDIKLERFAAFFHS